jgi:hypothetical protein
MCREVEVRWKFGTVLLPRLALCCQCLIALFEQLVEARQRRIATSTPTHSLSCPTQKISPLLLPAQRREKIDPTSVKRRDTFRRRWLLVDVGLLLI